MIEYLKNSDGLIYAIMEYSIVDKEGKIDDKGEYVFIREMYITPTYRNNGILKKLSWKLWSKLYWTKYFYFGRKKYGKRLRTYKINRLLKGEK